MTELRELVARMIEADLEAGCPDIPPITFDDVLAEYARSSFTVVRESA